MGMISATIVAIVKASTVTLREPFTGGSRQSDLRYWVAVKELSLTYYIGETLLFTLL